MGQERSSAILIVERNSQTRLSDARTWLRKHFDVHDQSCELVLTELISNALEHGDGGMIRVRVALDSTCLDVEVSNSVSEAPTIPSEKPTAPDPEKVRGRGLFLILQLADLRQRTADGRLSMHARVPLPT